MVIYSLVLRKVENLWRRRVKMGVREGVWRVRWCWWERRSGEVGERSGVFERKRMMALCYWEKYLIC